MKKWEFKCFICGVTKTITNDFYIEAIKELKKLGWYTQPGQVYCPKCKRLAMP